MRYRLVSDNSEHHYIIPSDKEEEFDWWVEITESDEDDYDDPVEEFDKYRLSGSPRRVTFTDPRED